MKILTPSAPSRRAALSSEVKLRLLEIILESRHADLREENLNRQGKGHFHVSGQGHEAMAALGLLMQPEDYACPYYRDRAFVMGRGVSTRQLALDYLAKAASSSHGRQMPAHFSFPEFHIWSVPTPTASQLLPACGMAWGMKLARKTSLTITSVGEAATRQGDFYEAIAFAKEKRLPLLLVVEDNGYGISSPTRRTNPMALNLLTKENWVFVDGWDVEAVYRAAQEQMERIRSGQGPVFLWVKMERISSHTSTDDQKVYRAAEELATLDERDPLKVFAAQLAEEGLLPPEAFARLDQETRERVRADYTTAEAAINPNALELENEVRAEPPQLHDQIFPAGKYRMGDLVNLALRQGLEANPQRVIFGEDVEDPKGGVFKLTKTLSTKFPGQVFNSPLAESTILGVACGLASYGWRPVFELQFIDFIYPGWNQLVTNLSTLRWRSNGKWICPAVIYAPYGAYLPGGSLWHSQANESAIAHFPGLNVVIPSTPEDAAGLLWTAMHTDDPTLILIPKHMLWAEMEVKEAVRAVPFGCARRVRAGTTVTMVAWGNTVEKALTAIAALGGEADVELIDLRSIVPWDRTLIEESVRKTGRLIVVQEDTENCSVGQMIISHLVGVPEVWNQLVSPPVLVSKGNVMIGYNPIYEFAALPDTARIVAATRRILAGTGHAVIPVGAPAMPTRASAPAAVVLTAPQAAALPAATDTSEIIIKVPIMGEGIRSARIVSLRKQPGDRVDLDDDFCEVETDKAVYPIQSSHVGIFGQWRVQVGDMVDIGREIASMNVPAGSEAVVPAAALPLVPQAALTPPSPTPPVTHTPPPRAGQTVVAPALPEAITRRLGAVIATNVQRDVRWQAVRAARDRAKQQGQDYSPSLIHAWCVVQAMKEHAAFRRLVQRDGTIVESTDFELGIAVSLSADRLATAVVHQASALAWSAFVSAYATAVEATRNGRIEEVQAPVNLSSLGSSGIERATPIVVPPAMGTLFIGRAHEKLVNDGGCVYPVEVVTLSLTFDHKVVNGMGAAAFIEQVRHNIEAFQLP